MKKLIVIVAVLVSGIVNAQKDYSDIDITSTYVNTKTIEHWVLYYINQERIKLGLDTFIVESTIDKIAKDHSNWMAKTGKYQHSGLNIRENITDNPSAVNTHKFAAYVAVRSWICSPGHYEAIQNPKYKYIGVGVAVKYSKFCIYYTTTFR
jgi:uncharacterized protein YkwD